MKRFSFPKKKRRVSNEQFKAVLARRVCVSNGLLKLFIAENDCGWPRLGVSVGRFCGRAVVRNRLKRLLREAFRQSQDRIASGFDYLLMICPDWTNKLDMSASSKKAAEKLTVEQVKASLMALAAEAAAKIR